MFDAVAGTRVPVDDSTFANPWSIDRIAWDAAGNLICEDIAAIERGAYGSVDGARAGARSASQRCARCASIAASSAAVRCSRLIR